MSTLNVSKQIKTAMKDFFVTRAEASKIVQEAEKGPVTVGEAKAIISLFEKAGPRVEPRPGDMVTLAIPESPGDVIFEHGATNVLNTFFLQHNIPAGKNSGTVKAQVKLSLEGVDLGERLAQAPDLKKLFPLKLNDLFEEVSDLPVRTAFIDMKKKEFFLKVEGGFTVDPSAKWFGPLKLKEMAWTMGIGEGPSDIGDS